MNDIHCFEVTEAIPIMLEFKQTLGKLTEKEADDILGTMVFLPAPKTWIEWRDEFYRMRVGILLIEVDKSAAAQLFISDDNSSANAMVDLGSISLSNGDVRFDGGYVPIPNGSEEWLRMKGFTGNEVALHLLSRCHLMLAIINTPKIIGRKQFMPHRGLERRLIRSLGVGKFPLHAWTEIKLNVAKPIEIEDGEPHEAHLTGRRALHFCRKHLRIRFGKLEYVSSHWRGDPALGIKQSRYSVVG